MSITYDLSDIDPCWVAYYLRQTGLDQALERFRTWMNHGRAVDELSAWRNNHFTEQQWEQMLEAWDLEAYTREIERLSTD